MLEQKIRNKIFSKAEGLKENVTYVLEALCEIQSGLEIIMYLLFLINDSKDN